MSEDLVNVTIDGVETQVPKGTLVIRAAEKLGTAVPRFCDHPLLDPVGACRQCIVEIEGQRKPMTACTTTVTDGMVVHTQKTSEVAASAQEGTMELLLINHPLDCPVCDKGGECPLQNQAMSAGRPETRFRDTKRTFAKPVPLSTEVLLDRERCVQCTRCTRFSEQIAGDPFIELFERSSDEQISVFTEAPDEVSITPEYETEPFNSYFSGNTIQICPVGALTSTAYRFRARPFDLHSQPSVCEHCASGCAQRTDVRRGKVLRRLAGNDPDVNEEWNCDKGRFAFTYLSNPPENAHRLTKPLVRDESGELREASWPEALSIAAEGLREARDQGAGAAVLPGGRLTLEDAYAYSTFARLVLGTNDIDMRARPHSGEEERFLSAAVSHSSPETDGVTYSQLEKAPLVLLAGFEPEDESPMVFLRLRKGVRAGNVRVASIAPYATRALTKLNGTLIQTTPGAESKVCDVLSVGGGGQMADIASGLRAEGAVILTGERLASVPGALSAVLRLARETGARVGWVPRRAGERGGIAAGLLPSLLPGGASIENVNARNALARLWRIEPRTLNAEPGRDAAAIVDAAAMGEISALLIAGLDPANTPDPAATRAAISNAGFVISCELRETEVTRAADVVFPIAPVAEKSGTFLTWEGRPRPFENALSVSGVLTDAQILAALAVELEFAVDTIGGDEAEPDTWMFRRGSVESVRAEYARVMEALGKLAHYTPEPPHTPTPTLTAPREGHALLATWHQLLDEGALQVGEEHLAGTARPSVARISDATASELGIKDGDAVSLFPVDTAAEEEDGSERAVCLPCEITQMPDRVVWVPSFSAGVHVCDQLGAAHSSLVQIAPGRSIDE